MTPGLVNKPSVYGKELSGRSQMWFIFLRPMPRTQRSPHKGDMEECRGFVHFLKADVLIWYLSVSWHTVLIGTFFPQMLLFPCSGDLESSWMAWQVQFFSCVDRIPPAIWSNMVLGRYIFILKSILLDTMHMNMHVSTCHHNLTDVYYTILQKLKNTVRQ